MTLFGNPYWGFALIFSMYSSCNASSSSRVSDDSANFRLGGRCSAIKRNQMYVYVNFLCEMHCIYTFTTCKKTVMSSVFFSPITVEYTIIVFILLGF